VLFERARGFWGGPRVPLSIAHPAPEAGSAAGAHPHESSERTQGVRAGSRGRPLPLARGTSCGVRDISWFEVMQASRPKVSRCEELSWGDLNDIPDRHPSFWMPARWRPETTRPCGMLRWRRRGCSQTPPWSSGRPPPGSVTGGDVSKLQVRSGLRLIASQLTAAKQGGCGLSSLWPPPLDSSPTDASRTVRRFTSCSDTPASRGRRAPPCRSARAAGSARGGSWRRPWLPSSRR
jgi:hypothetical protein